MSSDVQPIQRQPGTGQVLGSPDACAALFGVQHMPKGLRVQADTTGTFDVQRYSEESEMFSDVSGASMSRRHQATG
jgi:hypothetical protein